MSDSPEERLLKLGEAVTDDRAVDWEKEAARPGEPPELARDIRWLQQIDALRRAHRSIAALPSEPTLDQRSNFLFRWGPLEVLERVGKGSFGEVFRALDLRLRREVALKLRHPDATETDGHARRLLEEARKLARVHHPNVLVVHGVDVHDGRIGFWTDFIRGRTLADHLAEEGPFGPEETTLVGLTLCQALAAVHEAGVIHGDVKAANVMREDGGRIVLMDFGAASRRDDMGNPELQAAISFGTPLVLAPEIVRGEAAGPASDLYALGVLLYHLTTGRYPVEAGDWEELCDKHARGERTPLRDLRTDLPDEFVEVVERAIASDPAARFPDASAMEASLRASMRSPVGSFDDARGVAQTLRSLLDEIGFMPEAMCRQIGRGVAQALAFIHERGHVHGDLRPENTLVLRDGGVMLRRSDQGSVAFPEAAAESAELRRADLKRLGILLYEAATGDRASPPSEERLHESVSPFLGAVVLQLLEDDPADRSITARDIAQRFAEEERSAWWRERARALRRRTMPSPRRIRIARETTLHGRDAELRRLRALCVRAMAGEGQVVLLQGEAGIGKTRLVAELVSALERDGEAIHFLFGSYPPGGAATATGAFLTAYREHFGPEGLEETLGDYLASAPALIPPFIALLRGESESAGSNLLTKDSVQTAFVHITQALAAERPTIILIDDLHFASEDGLGLFAALAHAAPGHRVVVIGGARPGLPETWTAGILRQEHSTCLELARLADRDIFAIVAEALHSERLAEDLVPEMERRCDGNPLFLFATLRALEESGRVERDAHGDWQVSGVRAASQMFAGLPVPSSIQHLIQARIAALADEDRALLEVASCAGFEFDPVLVTEAAGLELLPALKRLAWIEKRHRLIDRDERSYVFDHHQVQEALYAGLMAPLRDRYHVALAEALETREKARDKDPKDLDGSIAVAICEHYFRGGRGQDGIRYLRRALAHFGSLRPSATVELIDRALAVPGLVTGGERIDLLMLKASQCPMLGRPADEESALREMLVLADEMDEPLPRARARSMLAFFENRMGRVDRARQLLEEAEVLARASGDSLEEANVAQTRGSLALHKARFEEALSFYTRSRELARRAGNRHLEAVVIGSSGIAHMGLRQFDEARRHYEKHLAIVRSERNRVGETIGTGNLGALLLDAEQYGEALPILEKHFKLAREGGMRLGEAYASGNLGMLFSVLGRSAESLGWLERSVRLCRETGYRAPEAENVGRLGNVLAMLGRRKEASHHYEQCLGIAREIQNSRIEAFALVGLGNIAQEAQDAATAESLYEQAVNACTAIHATGDVAEILLRHGALLRSRGRLEEARAHLAEAVEQAREFRSAKVEVLAMAHLAQLPGVDARDAKNRFLACEERLPLIGKMEASFLLWKATDDRSFLDRARKLLATLQAGAPERDREVMIREVPLYKEIAAAGALSA